MTDAPPGMNGSKKPVVVVQYSGSRMGLLLFASLTLPDSRAVARREAAPA